MRTLTAFILCLLLPGAVMAGVFDPSPTDKSVDLLGIIFGTHMGPIYLGGPPNPAIKHMFELLNAVVLSIGTTIVSYIGVVSVINTAQEGKTMGKKWNSIWIPMRATLGMILMVPTPGSGYSVVQTTIMWFILQGIGAADSIWNRILADLGSGLSPTGNFQERVGPRREFDEPAVAVNTNLLANGLQLTDQVMRSAVCMQVLQDIASGATSPDFNFKAPNSSVAARYGNKVTLYNIVNPNPVVNNEMATYNGTTYVGVQGNERYFDVCGKYQVSATVSRDEWNEVDRGRITGRDLQNQAQLIYSLKTEALAKMFSNLSSISREIARQGDSLKPRSENDFRLFHPFGGEIIEPAGYVMLAANTYALEMRTAIKPQKIEALQSAIRKGRQNGWISAGSFFFNLNHTSEVDYFRTVLDPPRAEAIPRCDERNNCTGTIPADGNILNEKLRNFLEYHQEKVLLATRLWDANVYLANDIAEPAQTEDDFADPIDNLQHRASVLVRNMMVEQHADPLIAQGKFGKSLMLASERSWQDLIQYQEVQVDYYAEQGIPLPDTVRRGLEVLNTQTALALSVYFVIWSVGAMLAIYLPLIPYLIFTVAAIGWLLLVIEAIVAAPVLALSFILPSGEELGKIMQGMMLLLNIILRPTLMLFGFVLATRLYQAVVQLVNLTIVGNLDNLGTEESTYAWLVIITIYGGFTVALANKCFSLIYALPDKTLRWMGGGPEHTDASQELHGVKGAISKGEDFAKQVSSGVAERNQVRIDSQVKQIGAPPDAVRGGKKGS